MIQVQISWKSRGIREERVQGL